jgi:hypothetical protein
MTWQIYLRKGLVYVPTVAQTEAGFYLGVEPVDVVPVANTEALQRAIWRAINTGNPKVATPTRANFPEPVLLRHADVKSWPAFERNALFWSVAEKDGSYEICRGRKRADRGWEDDPAQTQKIPSGLGLHEISHRIASLIQAAAGKGTAMNT